MPRGTGIGGARSVAVAVNCQLRRLVVRCDSDGPINLYELRGTVPELVAESPS